MKYLSTRGAGPVTLDQALLQGIAPDGGLYIAARLPKFDGDDFHGCTDIKSTARVLLAPFFAESALLEDLDKIIDETFCFPIPVTELPEDAGYAGFLELYHGATAAFKDVGAGFLAASLSRLKRDPAQPLTILVATSGDTGGAVAAAFDGRPGMRVVVLFPEGRVSERQEKQLTCWSDNVLSISVAGSFDDCQALVKEALADADLQAQHRFSSANSINIGRLLPQTIYYAHSSLVHFNRTGRPASYIVPTGNLGNAFACIMARAMGLPIRKIVLATNANSLVTDYLGGAEWEPRISLRTLASAMDVGNPSNMERLRKLLGEAEVLSKTIGARTVSDQAIEQQIQKKFKEYGFAICPHTATATFAYEQLSAAERSENDWILVATAHPAKFEQIVEPLIGTSLPLPDALAAILSRPNHKITIEPDMAALGTALAQNVHDQSGPDR